MSLRIVNVKQKTGVDYLEPFLIADSDETHSELVQVIKDCLESQSDRTLILCGYDEQEKGDPVLEGFIIANAPVHGVYGFILQAWVKPQTTFPNLMPKLFSRLVYWADSLGKTELRGETTRNTKPFLRKWGFEHLSSVLRYTIPTDFELQSLLGDKKNERCNDTTGNDKENSIINPGSTGIIPEHPREEGKTDSKLSNGSGNRKRDDIHGVGAASETALSKRLV